MVDWVLLARADAKDLDQVILPRNKIKLLQVAFYPLGFGDGVRICQGFARGLPGICRVLYVLTLKKK